MYRVLSAILLLTLVTGCASMGQGSVEDKRGAIMDMRNIALQKLYAEKPDTRAQINNAQGYAVFSSANVNLIFMAAGTGYGVVENRATGQRTFMNMAEGGIGFGLGVKDYRIVMVFHTQDAIKQFVESGWTFGGNADAAAKAAEKGGSVEAEAYYGDVSVYTLTESGLALQATIKGTKFWQDEQLN